MRIGSRALVVGLPSLLLAIACLSGENQCLNPQPDLPSCRGTDSNPGSFGGKSSFAGAPGTNTPTPAGGASSSGSAGRSSIDDGNSPNEGAAGSSSGDAGGAGGDSAFEPIVDGGAGGAAGSENGPL
jgi:hypothetical protein